MKKQLGETNSKKNTFVTQKISPNVFIYYVEIFDMLHDKAYDAI
jgi:hypothetical protein